MGLSISGGVFDPTKYANRISTEGQYTSSVTGSAFTTLLSISGKGFLNKAVLSTRANASNASQLKITIDGILVFNGQTQANLDQATGIIMDSDLSTTSANGGSFSRVNQAGTVFNVGRAYPYTAAGVGFSVISYPILFNSSLLVEAAVIAAASLANTYTIQGGYN